MYVVLVESSCKQHLRPQQHNPIVMFMQEVAVSESESLASPSDAASHRGILTLQPTAVDMSAPCMVY